MIQYTCVKVDPANNVTSASADETSPDFESAAIDSEAWSLMTLNASLISGDSSLFPRVGKMIRSLRHSAVLKGVMSEGRGLKRGNSLYFPGFQGTGRES